MTPNKRDSIEVIALLQHNIYDAFKYRDFKNNNPSHYLARRLKTDPDSITRTIKGNYMIRKRFMPDDVPINEDLEALVLKGMEYLTRTIFRYTNEFHLAAHVAINPNRDQLLKEFGYLRETNVPGPVIIQQEVPPEPSPIPKKKLPVQQPVVEFADEIVPRSEPKGKLRQVKTDFAGLLKGSELTLNTRGEHIQIAIYDTSEATEIELTDSALDDLIYALEQFRKSKRKKG